MTLSRIAPQTLTDQPLPRTGKHGIYLYGWWQLPSGAVVEVRKITGESNPECVVRRLNADAEMEPGEFVLRLSFLAKHGKQVTK